MKQASTHAAKQSIACALTVLAATCVTTPVTHAQCQYEVTAIIQGPPCGFGGGHAPLVGRGMNSHGHIAGSWAQCDVTVDEAFYWTPETGLVTLPRPSGVFSARATNINDAGLVIGGHGFSGLGWKAFVYDPKTQQYTYLEPLHEGVAAPNLSTLNAINNAGIAVGSRSIGKPGQSPNPSNAIIWNTNTGEVIDMGLYNGMNTWANDISDAGGVVGSMGGAIPTSGWVHIQGKFESLGPIPGGTTSNAFAINSAGDLAVGGWLLPNPDGQMTQGAIWRDSKWQPLPLLPGAIAGGPTAINELGQSGGSVGFPPDPVSDQVAVLWQHGEAHGLPALVDPLPPGMNIWTVRCLNDTGQVLTRAVHNGASIAVVLSPMDRPHTDLTGDCVTDVDDLLILLVEWGKRHLPADFNGDGTVDVSDLLILLSSWG